MIPDTSFRKFIEARQKHRDAIAAGKFPAYGAVVTPAIANPKTIVAAARESIKQADLPVAATGIAVQQQAIDMMSASQRASDLRAMGHMDLIRHYQGALPFIGRYEQSRLERFEAGRF
jgi:hypothetical protein